MTVLMYLERQFASRIIARSSQKAMNLGHFSSFSSVFSCLSALVSFVLPDNLPEAVRHGAAHLS